jgi:hypothetical protein
LTQCSLQRGCCKLLLQRWLLAVRNEAAVAAGCPVLLNVALAPHTASRSSSLHHLKLLTHFLSSLPFQVTMLDKNSKNKVSFKDVAGCDEAKVRTRFPAAPPSGPATIFVPWLLPACASNLSANTHHQRTNTHAHHHASTNTSTLTISALTPTLTLLFLLFP